MQLYLVFSPEIQKVLRQSNHNMLDCSKKYLEIKLLILKKHFHFRHQRRPLER